VSVPRLAWWLVALALLVPGCGAGSQGAVARPDPGAAAAPDPRRTLTGEPVTISPSPAASPSPSPETAHGGGHHHEGVERVELPDGVEPARVRIPAIGVDADVVPLGLLPDQTMEIPSDFAQAGWFTGAPRPGRLGAAIIAGHVDSRSGPAVFYRLDELRPGNRIEVAGPDGATVAFTVERVEQYPKDAFPSAEVYGYTPDATLRLITCGGDFDPAGRHYLDNVVVYATLADA
jgi:Sortase domain